jgi:hypothetical protein
MKDTKLRNMLSMKKSHFRAKMFGGEPRVSGAQFKAKKCKTLA